MPEELIGIDDIFGSALAVKQAGGQAISMLSRNEPYVAGFVEGTIKQITSCLEVGVVCVERVLDVESLGFTGSNRYRPQTEAETRERKNRQREASRNYQSRYPEKERERWRRIAAERRKRNPDATRDANRAYYAANRERILEQKRLVYASPKTH